MDLVFPQLTPHGAGVLVNRLNDIGCPNHQAAAVCVKAAVDTGWVLLVDRRDPETTRVGVLSPNAPVAAVLVQ